jgi:hypothetical protein
MPCPPDHKLYATKAKADLALAELIVDAKKSGRGGKSWKRLNVFPCGNHFHIGRANKFPTSYQPPAPAPEPKGPSAADLRRKAKRDAKAAARHHRFVQVTYSVYGTPEELSENIRIAHRMVEQLFSGK